MFPSSSGLHRSRRFEPIRRLKRDGTRTTRPFRDFIPNSFQSLLSHVRAKWKGRTRNAFPWLSQFASLSNVLMVPFPYFFFLSESVKMCLISLLLKHVAFESASRKKNFSARGIYMRGNLSEIRPRKFNLARASLSPTFPEWLSFHPILLWDVTLSVHFPELKKLVFNTGRRPFVAKWNALFKRTVR